MIQFVFLILLFSCLNSFLRLKYLTCKRRLPKPNECPKEIYEIMQEGWNERPEKRFSPQMIFSKLMMARK